MLAVWFIALLTVTAIYLIYWSRAKLARRRQMKARINQIYRQRQHLIRRMREEPADGRKRCQTESDLLVAALKGVDRAKEMAGLAERNCRFWLDSEQPALGAVQAAELELAKAACRLQVIQNHLRPLIGRMRRAASQDLATVAQALRAALETDVSHSDTDSLNQAIAATTAASEVALDAPVRALKEHELALRAAVLARTDAAPLQSDAAKTP